MVVPLFTGACMMSHEMQLNGPAVGCPATPATAGAASSAGGPGARPADETEWVGPQRSGDQETLARWCETVGTQVIMPDPRVPAPWTGGQALTAVVWNVWVGGGDLLAFIRTELGRTCDGGGQIGSAPDPFVILLQEVLRRDSSIPVVEPSRQVPARIAPDPEPGEDRDVVDVARRCGLALAYVPSTRNGAGDRDGLREDRGNAILSTARLADVTAVELPYEGARKVAVVATVEGPGGPLRIVSLHFDVASTLLHTLVTGNGTRLRQAKSLMAALDLQDPAVATVVGGDFTYVGSVYIDGAETETTLQRMARWFPDSPPIDRVPTRGGFTTDHIFFRAGPEGRMQVMEGSYRRIDEHYGSDHQARLMLVRARPGA